MITVVKAVLQDLLDGKTLVAAALIAFCVALSGPFGTYTSFPLWERSGYWGLMVFAALPTSMTLRHVLIRFGYREASLVFGLTMVAAMAVIYGSFVWMVSHNYPRIDRDLIPAYPVLVLIVGLVTVIVVLARRINAEHASTALALPTDAPDPLAALFPMARLSIDPQETALQDPATDGDNDPPPRLMRRLPDVARGPVHRLEARNHFVHVVIADETYAIRLRFADAVDEMDSVPGLCTHRSHWVRLNSVLAAERAGTRLVLCIADGARVPVSRGYRDRVEAAGLINPEMLAAASAMERLAAQ